MNNRSKLTTSDFRSNPLLSARAPRPAVVEGNLNSFGRQKESKAPKKPFSNQVGLGRRSLTAADKLANAESIGPGGSTAAAAAAAAANFQEGIDHVENVDFSTAARSVSDPQLLDFAGDFIWFQSSTNSSDKLRIRIGRHSNPFLTLLPGQSIGGRRFKKIWLAWAQVVGAAGVLIVSNNHGQTVIVTG
jgi:hypothetical protein